MTESKNVPITPEGLAQIQQELDELINVRRPDIIAKIKAAREHGDLSENFEYHAARNEQSFLESHIQKLEEVVRNHVLVETKPKGEIVEILSRVTFCEEGGTPETYQIVPAAEADATKGKLSSESAIARALLGHRIGQEVEVETPSGERYTLSILRVD